MQTIKIADKQVVLADGKWRSSVPALQDLLNDHLAAIQSDIPDTLGREERERFAAEAAARDFGAQIVDSLLTPVEQKDRERHQLEVFKASYSNFPTGTIVEAEGPDFLVEQPSATVGIELTEMFRTTAPNEVPRQAIESLMKQIVYRAQSNFEKAGGPALYVYVHFAPRVELRKSQVADLAQCISRIVADHPIALDQHIELHDGNLPEQICLINILRPSFITDALWAAPDGGAVPHLSVEAIQSRIDEKNCKIPSYRNKASGEIWLVIVHGFPMSSWFVRSDAALEHIYKSGFDRVFLFDMFRQLVDPLTTR